MRRRSNCSTADRRQKVTSLDFPIRTPRSLYQRHIHTLETTISPRLTPSPRISRQFLGAAQTNLCTITRALRVLPRLQTTVFQTNEDQDVHWTIFWAGRAGLLRTKQRRCRLTPALNRTRKRPMTWKNFVQILTAQR